jgi:hypothetical protein
MVQTRSREASCNASAANSSAPRSWKWLGQVISMRFDSSSSGKLAAAAHHAAGHRGRSARWTSTALAISTSRWIAAIHAGATA